MEAGDLVACRLWNAFFSLLTPLSYRRTRRVWCAFLFLSALRLFHVLLYFWRQIAREREKKRRNNNLFSEERKKRKATLGWRQHGCPNVDLPIFIACHECLTVVSERNVADHHFGFAMSQHSRSKRSADAIEDTDSSGSVTHCTGRVVVFQIRMEPSRRPMAIN